MCNDFKLEIEIATILEDFAGLMIKIAMPEGLPNVAARTDIKITDRTPIVRTAASGRDAGELVNRPWSWRSQHGKPVYNVRSEGRNFASHRFLVPTDGFYEFTDSAYKAQKRLDKMVFHHGRP